MLTSAGIGLSVLEQPVQLERRRAADSIRGRFSTFWPRRLIDWDSPSSTRGVNLWVLAPEIVRGCLVVTHVDGVKRPV